MCDDRSRRLTILYRKEQRVPRYSVWFWETGVSLVVDIIYHRIRSTSIPQTIENQNLAISLSLFILSRVSLTCPEYHSPALALSFELFHTPSLPGTKGRDDMTILSICHCKIRQCLPTWVSTNKRLLALKRPSPTWHTSTESTRGRSNGLVGHFFLSLQLEAERISHFRCASWNPDHEDGMWEFKSEKQRPIRREQEKTGNSSG